MVCDDQFALRYFRPLPGGRLLWGGRCQTYGMSDASLKEAMTSDLVSVFPQLQGVRMETVWGGTLGFSRHMMPLIGEIEPGLWACTAFGGHGVVATTLGGELVASAIASGGKDTRWRMFMEDFPVTYAGWPFGPLLSQLAYWGYQIADHWALWRQRR